MKIDINCDMGESFGAYTIGRDTEIMPYITSANIACGFHAGDPKTMHDTVKSALQHQVAIGAHPGLPDLVGFGRRQMALSPREAHDIVVYQIGALWAFVRAEGGALQHVKPHGALYNMAAVDAGLAGAVAEAVYRVDPELILFGLAGSELVGAGERIGLRVASEVFADREYEANGLLRARGLPHAVISDSKKAAQQALAFAQGHQTLIEVPVRADTICIHGDGAHALEFAQAIRETLDGAGIVVQAVGRTLE